jgi:hypothetical protein
MKVNWIGGILLRTCLLKQVTEEKIDGVVEVTGRRRRRCKLLLDDRNEKRGYRKLKELALTHILWRNGFGRGFGPDVRQAAE